MGLIFSRRNSGTTTPAVARNSTTSLYSLSLRPAPPSRLPLVDACTMWGGWRLAEPLKRRMAGYMRGQPLSSTSETGAGAGRRPWRCWRRCLQALALRSHGRTWRPTRRGALIICTAQGAMAITRRSTTAGPHRGRRPRQVKSQTSAGLPCQDCLTAGQPPSAAPAPAGHAQSATPASVVWRRRRSRRSASTAPRPPPRPPSRAPPVPDSLTPPRRRSATAPFVTSSGIVLPCLPVLPPRPPGRRRALRPRRRPGPRRRLQTAHRRLRHRHRPPRSRRPAGGRRRPQAPLAKPPARSR